MEGGGGVKKGRGRGKEEGGGKGGAGEKWGKDRDQKDRELLFL